MKYTTTALTLNNDPKNPLTLKVAWTVDEDEHGWTGKCVIWRDHKIVAQGYTVQLRQTQPLGEICVDIDECPGAGSWMFFNFEGTSITERDLQWATVFAAAAIQHKRASKREKKLEALD